MKVATGTVVDGKVVMEGGTFAEGSTVTVVLRKDDEAFELTLKRKPSCLNQLQRSSAESSFPGSSSWSGFAGSIPDHKVVEGAVV